MRVTDEWLAEALEIGNLRVPSYPGSIYTALQELSERREQERVIEEFLSSNCKIALVISSNSSAFREADIIAMVLPYDYGWPARNGITESSFLAAMAEAAKKATGGKEDQCT